MVVTKEKTMDISTKVISNAPKVGTDLAQRDLSWFAAKVAQGQKGIFAEVVTITPAIAKRILEQNADNRPISPKYIRQIAHDIKCKQWVINGETIIISDDGWLNDGQNRLLGIIEAGEPVQALVCFGVTRRSRMTVDMGRSRTTTHYLGMDKVANAHYAAIIASQWAAYELGYFGQLTKLNSKQNKLGITKQDTLRFYYDHKEMVDEAVTKLKSQLKYIGSHGTGTITAYCILQTIDPLYTNDFFESLLKGSGLQRDDVILELRNQLIAGARNLDPYEKCEMILRYWMAWKDGKKIRKKISLRREWPANLNDYGREPPAKHDEE
jgi:hypothetical protein